MDIPREKHQKITPITGASARGKDQGSLPRPTSPPAADAASEEDIAISDDVFRSPVISLPPRSGTPGAVRTEPAPAATAPVPLSAATSTATPASDPAAETANPPAGPSRRNARKKPLERRSTGQPARFNRMIRPETALAAHAAVSQARAESPVDTDKVERDAMQFGKIHQRSTPDYRPNKLFRVLDGMYTHSPLRWLDFIERSGGARIIIATVLLVVVGGFVAWRYFESFSGAEPVATFSRDAVASTPDRIAAASRAVEEFLKARTIEDRLPHVLDPERASARMKLFYDTQKGIDPNVQKWEVGEPVSSEHGTWLPLVFQDDAGRTVTIVIGESDAGCRIDWENFTAFGEALWPEYCRQKPVVPTAMRVRLRAADRYEGIYNKEAWQSYEIEHRSGEPRLLGYAARAGRTSQALAEVVKGTAWQCAQLYLRFDASSGDAGLVVIDDVVRNRWQDEATSWTGP